MPDCLQNLLHGKEKANPGALLSQQCALTELAFRHDNGAQVFFEIVGFWTPEYLAAKRLTLSRFRDHRILIAVARRSVRPDVGDEVILYNTALKLAPVLAALNALGIG